MAKTVQERLAEARDALHELQIGKTAVEISYNGGVTKYARANIGDLRAYIRDLEVEAGERTQSRRAIGVSF